MSDKLRDAELHDALNRLARRGTPRGFDAVLAGAAAAAERDVIASDSVRREPGAGRGDEDLEPIPFVTAEPPPRRRRPLGSMIAAAGVAALLVVGTLAVSAVFGNSGSGSSSAQGAVRRLADALSHEDPLAAADVLAPQEVRSLHGTVESAERKAAELQLVQAAGAPLAGVDFNVDNLQLSTESLADGYTKVVVDRGSFTASTRRTQFSPLMQKVLRASGDNSSHADLDKLASKLDMPTFVVAVRDGGKWYVSAAYTVLEYIREYNRLPAADFGSGQRAVATLGASTPDAAVQDSVRALQQSDWAKLFSLAPPAELPVYDYRAALTELIRRSREGDTPTPFTIASMTTQSQVDGDTAKVTLNASGTTGSGTWSFNGGCFSPPTETLTGGQGPAPTPAPTPAPCIGRTAYILSPFALLYGFSGTSTQIAVVRRDGRWFVSPVGTVLDSIDQGIAALDQRSLYSMLNIPGQLPADGTLTLGTTITMPASDDGPRVLSFAGKAGEQLLGLSTPSEDSYDSTPLYVRVFGPDGKQLYQADGMFNGQAFTLPVDGPYKFVVTRQYLSTGKVVTVTVWDAADAPAAAKDNHGQQCTYTENGTTCSSSSTGVVNGQLGVATTVPSETCTSTPDSKSCASTPTTFMAGGSDSTPTSVAIGDGVSVSSSGATATSTPGG